MAKSKNRAKRRQESKKIEEVISDDTNLVDKLFIAGGVLLFILAFYGLTVYITNKNSDDTNEEKEKNVEISSDKIILGRSLSMSKDDYYVVYYTSDNSTMDEIVNNYNGELKLYKVDMSSAFNKKYATDGESNKNPSKTSEFKINGATLIKVSNKQVVEYTEGEDAIRTILN
jgi:hypothetical protein